MAELTWDQKNKLALARRAEKDYQFWATGGLTKPKHDTGGDGGPRRGGKAKYTKTQVLDDSGETLTEKNIDEDGVEITQTQKTPASVFEMDEQQNYEILQPSIAAAPAATVVDPEQQRLGKLYQEQRELAGVRDLGVRFGDEPYNLSPVIGADGRYLLNSEYYGEPAAHWESAPINKEVVYNEETQEFEVQSEPDPVVNDTGLVWQSDNDIYLAQDKIRQDYDERDLMDIRNHHPDLFVQMMNEGGFESRPDPHPHAGEGFIENEEGEIVPVAEVASELEENLDVDGDGDNEEANNKLKYDSINTLATEDPEKIKVLNSFATWAADVSDAESLRAAEDYLENLRNEPTVHDRVKKAMAIAFAAMLFGDDLTTAMNTGFGVVSDDYAAEALADKTEAEAAAALQKTLATEARANAEWDRRKVINEQYDYAKWLREHNLTESKEAEEAAEAITAGNFDYIKDRSAAYWDSIKGTKAADKFNNINDFQIQMDRAYDWMNRNWKGLIDFENNVDQRVGFEHAFAKWMRDKQVFKAPAFENYIQDAFIKLKFAKGKDGSTATYIEPTLISPSVEELIAAGSYNVKTVSNGKESVAALYKKVENQIIPGVGSEKHALMLLKKDFNHYRDYEFDGSPAKDSEKGSSRYQKMLKHAHKLGEGVFTRFVNQLPADSIWGFVYDPDAKGKSATQLGVMSAEYLASN